MVRFNFMLILYIIIYKFKKSIAILEFRCYNIKANADVVKLADTLDLGSSASACRFDSCHPHHCVNELRGIEVFLCFIQNTYHKK